MRTKYFMPVLAAVAFLSAGINQARAQVSIALVDIGNAGNAPDKPAWGAYGAVSYDYSIGKYDVTVGQYTAFLNVVAASDPYGLYKESMGTDEKVTGITRTGTSGSYVYAARGDANTPITYVTWFDAARFSNWLANGQGNSTTENGAYTLNGATSGTNCTKNAVNPNTEQAPTFWIPSINEWYKAAYYDPKKDGPELPGYWLYPTMSEAPPGNIWDNRTLPGQANYNSATGTQPYLTPVGTYIESASAYGTYDQGGNVWQWTDQVIDSNRVLRGGAWNSPASALASDYSYGSLPPSDFAIGFRVAGIPEPLEWQMLLVAGAVLLGWRYLLPFVKAKRNGRSG
ncbi:MAG: SUMF1/EgtB/PvdO family nonheme iron enzyme [Verrucomicrobiae bacterium]